MPIPTHKTRRFEDLTPKMWIMNETTKKHFLARKRVVWRIDRQNRDTGAGSARAEKSEQILNKKVY